MITPRFRLLSVLITAALSCVVTAARAGDGWVADATTTAIPDHAAAGLMHGKEFKPKFVYVHPYTRAPEMDANRVEVTFATSKEFMVPEKPDGKVIRIMLLIKSKETLDGKTFLGSWSSLREFPGAITSVTDGNTYSAVQGVSTTYIERGMRIEQDLSYDLKLPRYSVQLTFGKKVGKTISGKIYVSFGDNQKSFLAGTFKAYTDITFPDKEIK